MADKLMSSIFQVPTMAIEKVHMYNNTSIIQDEVCACAVCSRADVATSYSVDCIHTGSCS